MNQDYEAWWADQKKAIGALFIACWSSADPIAQLHFLNILLSNIESTLRRRFAQIAPPGLEAELFFAVGQYVERYLQLEKFNQMAAGIEPDAWHRDEKLAEIQNSLDLEVARIKEKMRAHFAPDVGTVKEEAREEVALILADLQQLTIARLNWYKASHRIDIGLVYQEHVGTALVPVIGILTEVASRHQLSQISEGHLADLVSVAMGNTSPPHPPQTARPPR